MKIDKDTQRILSDKLEELEDIGLRIRDMSTSIRDLLVQINCEHKSIHKGVCVHCGLRSEMSER